MNFPRIKTMPAIMAALLSTLGFDIAASKFDELRENKAHAESQQTIRDCRDLVRCFLTQFHQGNKADLHLGHKVDYKLTDKTITIRGVEFQVGKSKNGDIWLDRSRNEYYVVGNTEVALENLNLLIQDAENNKPIMASVESVE